MSDLISRADAIEAIFIVGQEHVADDVLPLGAVLDYIDAIKEVEAVHTWEPYNREIPKAEIIRCRECKNWNEDEENKGFGHCGLFPRVMKAHGYCGHGERKEATDE